MKHLEQGFVDTRLKSSLQNVYDRPHELVDRYGISICTMKTDLVNGSYSVSFLFRLHRSWHFLNNSAVFLEKQSSMLPFFRVRIAHLLYYFSNFVRIILVTLCSLSYLSVLSRSMIANATSVFKDPDGAKTLSTIHDKYVVVPTDKDNRQHCFCLQNVLHPMFIRGRRRK